MKNYYRYFIVLLAVMCIPVACTNVPPSAEYDIYDDVSQSQNTYQFNDVRDRDWFLTELRTGLETIIIDRTELAEKGIRGIFTLRFDAELASGVGVPNRYRAPYTLADNQTLSIGLIASTLMASLFEPDELKEHEYMAVLQNVSRWNLADEKLELYSQKNDGTEVILVFTLSE
ncbi:MAG: META domain-containing protein [Treponema sp.]|nr:META domain-containing protein [Treponema sp.]